MRVQHDSGVAGDDPVFDVEHQHRAFDVDAITLAGEGVDGVQHLAREVAKNEVGEPVGALGNHPAAAVHQHAPVERREKLAKLQAARGRIGYSSLRSIP